MKINKIIVIFSLTVLCDVAIIASAPQDNKAQDKKTTHESATTAGTHKPSALELDVARCRYNVLARLLGEDSQKAIAEVKRFKEILPDRDFELIMRYENENGYTLIFHALFNRNYDVMQFIKDYSDLNHLSQKGTTLLLEAIYTNDVECVRQVWNIVKGRVDINNQIPQPLTALHYAIYDAIKFNCPEIVSFILHDCQADYFAYEHTLYVDMAFKAHISNFKSLEPQLSAAEIDARTKKMQENSQIIKKMFLEYEQAFVQKYVKEITGDPNAIFNKLIELIPTTKKRFVLAIYRQIKSTLSKEQLRVLLTSANQHSHNLLMAIAYHECVELTRELCAEELVNINAIAQNGDTAISLALTRLKERNVNQVIKLVEILLNHGANVNIATNEMQISERTPFCIALNWFTPELVELFLTKSNIDMFYYKSTYSEYFDRLTRGMKPTTETERQNIEIIRKMLIDAENKQTAKMVAQAVHKLQPHAEAKAKADTDRRAAIAARAHAELAQRKALTLKNEKLKTLEEMCRDLYPDQCFNFSELSIEEIERRIDKYQKRLDRQKIAQQQKERELAAAARRQQKEEAAQQREALKPNLAALAPAAAAATATIAAASSHAEKPADVGVTPVPNPVDDHNQRYQKYLERQKKQQRFKKKAKGGLKKATASTVNAPNKGTSGKPAAAVSKETNPASSAASAPAAAFGKKNELNAVKAQYQPDQKKQLERKKHEELENDARKKPAAPPAASAATAVAVTAPAAQAQAVAQTASTAAPMPSTTSQTAVGPRLPVFETLRTGQSISDK